MASPRAPVEAKVQAGALAATIAGAVVWVLQTYVFKGAVSAGLQSLIYAAVPGLLALVAGYFAPHTPRARVATVVPSVSYALPPHVSGGGGGGGSSPATGGGGGQP